MGQENAMESLLWQKKRATQEKIQKYKELKLQRQIEAMERQQLELKEKVERDRTLERARKRRNEALKLKISKHQEEKAKQEQENMEQEKERLEKEKFREQRRQEYFERQRKNIEDFRMQKELTESLLMIAQPRQGKNHVSNSSIKEYRKSIQQSLMNSQSK